MSNGAMIAFHHMQGQYIDTLNIKIKDISQLQLLGSVVFMV